MPFKEKYYRTTYYKMPFVGSSTYKTNYGDIAQAARQKRNSQENRSHYPPFYMAR